MSIRPDYSFIWVFLLAIFLLPVVFGAVNPQFVPPSPDNGSNISGAVIINWTFSGLSNSSIYWGLSQSGPWNLICEINSSLSPQNCSWDTSIVEDNINYLLNLTVVNSSDSGDYGYDLIVGLTVDNTPPNASLLFPEDGHNFTDETPFFNWSAYDNIDLNLSCGFYLDGALNTTAYNGTDNYSVAMSEGSHQWYLNCSDDSGNINVTSVRGFFNNITLQPEFIPPSPDNGSNISDTVLFNFTYNGLASWQLDYNNGSGWNLISTHLPATAPQSVGWDTTQVSDGRNYTIRLTVVEAGVETAYEYIGGLTVDNTPPSLILGLPEDNEYVNESSIFFNWTAWDSMDSNVSCNFSIDGLLNLTFGNETTNITRVMDEGNHSWNITCKDYTGNSNSSLLRNFVVDLTPPQIISMNISPYFSGFTNATPFINFTVNENHLLSCYYHINDSDINRSLPIIPGEGDISYCAGSLPAQGLLTELNITLFAYDLSNNSAQSSKYQFLSDNSSPSLSIIEPPNNTITTDGMVVNISVLVQELGSGIADGSPCRVTLKEDFTEYDNNTDKFNGTVLYNLSSGYCEGNITLGEPSGLSVNNSKTIIIGVYLDDNVNNQGFGSSSFLLDNKGPLLVLSGSNRSNNVVNSQNDSVLITISVYDNSPPLTAFIGNNSVINMSNSSIQNNFMSFSVETTPYELGCPETGSCITTFFLNDSWNNSKNYENLSIIIDNGPPELVESGTNSSGIVLFNNPVLFYAKWSDESLESTTSSQAILFKGYNGSFNATQTMSLNNSMVWSNFTYYTDPVLDEGKNLTFFIEYEDLAGYTNRTPNMSLVVQNRTPYIINFSVNNSIGGVSNETPVFKLWHGDEGSGYDSSLLTISNSAINLSYIPEWDCSLTSIKRFYDVASGTNLSFNISHYNLSEYHANITSVGSDGVSLLVENRGSFENVFVNNNSYEFVGYLRVGVVVNPDNTTNLSFSDYSNNESLCYYQIPRSLAEGLYNASIVVYDNAGNNVSSSVVWNVDGFRPSIINLTIEGSEIGDTVVSESEDNLVNVSWWVNDTYLNHTYLLIKGQYNTSLYDYSGIANNSFLFSLAPGTHKGIFRAYDVTPDPTTRSFTLILNSYDNISRIVESLSNRINGTLVLNSLRIYQDGLDITSDTNSSLNGSIDLLINLSSQLSQYIIWSPASEGLSYNWNNTFGFRREGSGDPESDLLGLMTGINISELIVPEGYYYDSEYDNFLVNNSGLLVNNITFNATGDLYIAVFDDKNVSPETPVYLLRECNGSLPSKILWNESCYIKNSSEYTVFMPMIGGFGFGFDRGDPNITILSPLTLVNNSFFDFDFDVIEPSPATIFCSYELRNSTDLLFNASLSTGNFSLNRNSYHYRKKFNNISLTDSYLLNLSCYDSYGNSKTVENYFALDDNTEPSIISAETSEVGLYSAVINISLNEPSKTRVYYGVNSVNFTEFSDYTGYDYNHSIIISGLSTNTRYYYYLHSCDYQNNCVDSSIMTFKTDEYTGRNSWGSGGGGGSELSEGVVIASDYHGWNSLNEGWLSYTVNKKNLPVTSVSVLITNTTHHAYIQLKGFLGKPDNLPAADNFVYQYFQVETNNILDYGSEFSLDFRVPSDWLFNISSSRDKVHLYRFELGDWKEYKVSWVKSDDEFEYFRTSLPGFSFFAITAEGVSKNEAPSSPASPKDGQEFIEDTQVVDDLPDENKPEDTGSVSVTASYEHKTSIWWFLIPILILAFIAGGFLVYKSRHVVSEEHHDENTDDPLYPLRQYIREALAHGHSIDQIKEKLLSVGWDDVVVDEELSRVVGES